MKHFALINFILLAVLNLTPVAQAQLRPDGSGDSSGPIAISADHLKTDETGGLATFTGAVVARQGQMTLTCDIMKVYYSSRPETKIQPVATSGKSDDTGKSESPKEPTSPFDNSARQVDKVHCNGNVKVVEGDRMAVGQTAVYMANSLPRRIILTGEARVWQGRDSLTGHQVTYMLDQKMSTVDGNRRSRVRTIFHQQDAK